MAKEIIVDIDDEGGIEVKTHGIKGKACMKLSQFIEEALGKVVSTKKTGEYYAEEIPERVKVNRGSDGN